MTAGGGTTYPEVVRLLKGKVAQKGQRTVARESGIALLSIQRYLKGIGEPTNATLQKLADYFEVSVADLRGEEKSYPVTTMSVPSPAKMAGVSAPQKEDLIIFRFREEFVFSTSRNEFCTETMKVLGKYFSQPKESRKPEEILDTIEGIWEQKAETINEFVAHNGNPMSCPEDDFSSQKTNIYDALDVLGGEIVEIKILDDQNSPLDPKKE